MNDFKITKSKKYWLINNDKIGLSDFGDTFEEAKENFKQAIDLMIQNKFEEMQNE